MTKAVKHFSAIRQMLEVFESAAEEYVMFLLLLSMSILFFIIVGMQLFGGKLSYCVEESDLDLISRGEINLFDDLFSSFVSVFRILAMDDCKSNPKPCNLTSHHPSQHMLTHRPRHPRRGNSSFSSGEVRKIQLVRFGLHYAVDCGTLCDCFGPDFCGEN